MRRFPDWVLRLEAAIDRARQQSFEWGSHNCGFFVADVVLAMTGVDPGAEYRGRYKTRRGAYAVVKRVTGGGMLELAMRAFGEPRKAPLLAQRGDVVLVETELGDTLGIVLGAKIAATGLSGLEFLPISEAKVAWAI